MKRAWGTIIDGHLRGYWLQLADALTKENADAMDVLRGAMTRNLYHLNNESVMLQSAAEQRAIKKKRPTETRGSEVLFAIRSC